MLLCLAGCTAGTNPTGTALDDEKDIPTVFSDMSIELDTTYNGLATIAHFDARWRMQEKEHKNGKTLTLYPHTEEDSYVFTYDETKSKTEFDFTDERVSDTFVKNFENRDGYALQKWQLTSINKEDAIEIHFTQQGKTKVYGVYYFFQWDGYDITLTYLSPREIPQKELRAIDEITYSISVLSTVTPEMTPADGQTGTPQPDAGQTATPSATN